MRVACDLYIQRGAFVRYLSVYRFEGDLLRIAIFIRQLHTMSPSRN